ncbi:MAG: His/Gly/Thr/Pro-type tRNA ligase C-terminal domain-containing protein, partial [Methanobacterium sp.]
LIPAFPSKIDFYIVIQSNDYLSFARKVANILRENGYKVIIELARRSFKSQMRDANKVQSKYAAIIGEQEFADNSVAIKNMETSEQIVYTLDNLQKTFKK